MIDLNSASQPDKSDLANSETVSIMEIVMRFVRYWKWFVLGIAVALIIVFLYLRYTTPVYNVTSSVVLKEAQSQRFETSIGGMDGLQLGGLGAVSNLENEIYILQSRSIIRNVINRLNLHTSYIVSGRIKKNDLYKESPVIVSMEQGKLDSLNSNISFEISTNNETNTITVSGLLNESEQIDTVFTSLPTVLHTPHGIISFTKRPGTKMGNSDMTVIIMHPNAIIRQYRSSLSVQQASRQSSVLNLSINTPYP